MNIQLLHKALRVIKTTLAMLSPVQHNNHKDLQGAWQPIPVQSDKAIRQEYLRQREQRQRHYY